MNQDMLGCRSPRRPSRVDPVSAGLAVLFATSWFHHPAHVAEWANPAVDAEDDDVWQLMMGGRCVAKRRREL